MPDRFSMLALLSAEELEDREKWLTARLEKEIRESVKSDLRISLVKVHAEQKHRRAAA